ncbi:MAG: hypothetical protein J5633_07500 [Oscillospiraceae bacterium]|nr:hypothetical protein [Oscillospiraceae bacterium]
MSASREKRIRFEERAEGKEKRQIRAKDNQKTARRKKLITTVAIAVIVVVLVLLVVVNSTLFYTGVPALKIGGSRYTAADFNYEYFSNYYQTYSSISTTYGDYASLLLDPSQPLNKQYYSETETWADYFEGNALTQLQQMTILNDMADKEGWTLSAERAAQIEDNLNQLKTDAVNQGYSDYKTYLQALYGKGMTEKNIRELLLKSFKATYYSQDLVERWKAAATDEEKQAYYDGVQSTYNLITYMMYHVDGSPNDEEGIDSETAMLAAKNTADEIASAVDQITFADAVRRLAPEEERSAYESDDACLTRNAAPSNIDTNYRSWLTDAAREFGETTVIQGSSGYDVVMFLESNDNRFRLVNYRGIVISVGTDDEGRVTDATMKEAQDTVDAIMEEYNADPTEDTFAKLANEYNGTTTLGGLQEDVVMGTLSNHELEEYLFDESARQPGDIYSFYDNKNFYIAYFVGYGDQYNLRIAENLMAEEQYTGMMEAAQEEYEIKKLLAFRFTK